MTDTITGTLTDYALMTEGIHTGRYGARIDDIPYPVMQYVDSFLLRLQKGERVSANLNKDKWISKIQRAKPEPKSTIPQGSTIEKPGVVDVAGDAIEQAEARVKAAKETAEMKAKLAHDEELLADARKAEQAAVPRDPSIDEKLKKNGFDQPAADPMAAMKERAIEEMRVRVGQEKIMKAVIPGNPSPATVIIASKYTSDELALVKATVAKGCTDTEFEFLMYLAKAYGLDPLRRQIWAVKYGTSPATIFTGRDGYLEIAHRSGVFDGMESGAKQEGEEIIGWCKVYRKDMSRPFYVEAFLKEYTTGKSLWQSKPRVMIQKVAESQSLRRAFSISGLYSPEEFDTDGCQCQK